MNDEQIKQILSAPHMPYARCFDKDWHATHHSNTDVTKTWRRFGWTPIERGSDAQTN